MAAISIRQELVYTALDNADALTDFEEHKDINERYEFKKTIILNDESLNKDEKTEAIKILTIDYDYNKFYFRVKAIILFYFSSESCDGNICSSLVTFI